MLTDSKTGLFPSNYVTMLEDDEAVAPTLAAAPAPMAAEVQPPVQAPEATETQGATATALYDYEAGEDNELSFPENAIITNVVSAARASPSD